MGGVQNGTGALVTDEFEGDLRGTVFGLFSVFVGIGGILFTMVAANLGAQQWYNASLAYLVMVPMLILELICIPKGNKEAKPTKGNHIKVPKEVLAIGAIGFFYFALTPALQLQRGHAHRRARPGRNGRGRQCRVPLQHRGHGWRLPRLPVEEDASRSTPSL